MSRKKKSNEYDINGDFGVGITSNTGAEFYFDIEDYERIKDYCWNEHALSNGYHSLEAWQQTTKKIVRMPWVIMGKWCDHINHNPLDNRKSNLRFVSQQENVYNRGIQKTNTSGVIGVYWLKDRNKWRAQLRKSGEQVHISDHTDFLSAIKARLAAEAKFFGEYSPQLHLFQRFGIQAEVIQ